MPLIALQAGHQNITGNCVAALRGGTGAPGEVEFTVRTRDAVSQLLIKRGFQVQLVDANFNCNPDNTKDFDLFLAIHYDANVYGRGGGVVGAPDPSVDAVNAESRRIRDALTAEYFPRAGIENHPERLNPNITYYYMWQYLTAKTPCVLIECGVGQDAHDKVILADTQRVAEAIARGLCRAFNVPYDQNPAESCDTKLARVKELVQGTGTIAKWRIREAMGIGL